MKQSAAEHERDGDAILIYAMAMGKPGDALYARIESLAAAGVGQTIVGTFATAMLANVGKRLVSSFG